MPVAVSIAAGIIAVLMLLSRFLTASKPAWDHMPRVIAVLLPGVVLLIPQIVELLQQTKTFEDLVAYIIGSVTLVIVGLFPKPTEPIAL